MKSALKLLALASALSLGACIDLGQYTGDNPQNIQGGPADPRTQDQTGSAQINVSLGKVGVLAKAAQAQDISLRRLYIVLSSPGSNSIYDTLPLSGNNTTLVTKVYANLASMKTWTLAARSADANDSVIHSGSISFDVSPRQTASANLDLSARYAMLKARFYPIRDSVASCALFVDGFMRANAVFGADSSRGDTVTLSFDYLSVGASHSIRMAAYGRYWGADTLLYAADTAFTVQPGDASYHLRMDWKGPYVPPAGQASMRVNLGVEPTYAVDGFLVEPYQTRGLAAFYPFTSGGKDESGNGNDARVTGALPVPDRFGHENRAFHFNGSGDVLEAPDSPTLKFDTAVTVICWAKPERVTGLATLVGKWYAPDNFLLLIQDGQYKFSVSMPGGDWGAVYSAAWPVPSDWNRWTQVAGVFDGKTVTLYVDGEPMASVPAPGKLQGSSMPLDMGNHPDWNAYLGSLDGVRLYKRALSRDEVQGLYWDGWQP